MVDISQELKNELLASGSDLPSVFIMRFYSKLSTKEIAEIMLCSESDVESKLKTIEAIVSKFKTKKELE